MIMLVLLVVVGVLIWMAVSHQKSSSTAAPGPRAAGRPASPRTPGTAAPTAGGLDEALARWVGADLLTREQAGAITEHEHARAAVVPVAAGPTAAPPRRTRVPVVAEALGYLGGILAIVGLVLVLVHYWPDLATAGRLALSATGAAALVGGGFLVREESDPALARLRWFLWLAATAATAVFAGVLADDVLDGSDETIVALGAGAVALLSGLLWWGRERPLQQLTLLGGVAVFVGAAVNLLSSQGPAGVAVWAVGIGFLLLGLGRRTPLPLLTVGAGTLAVLAGALLTVDGSQAYGLVFTALTGFGLLALTDLPRLELPRADRLVLAIPAAIVVVQTVPPTLVYFARDAGIVTGLVTWGVGGLLLLVGIKGLVRLPVPTEVLGGVALLGGAALTAAQWEAGAPVFGLLTAIGLLGLGMLPGQVLLSLLGAVGLLVNVPWAIAELFPGEGRAPLLIMVSGALLVAVAVLLTRMGDRFRHDLGGSG